MRNTIVWTLLLGCVAWTMWAFNDWCRREDEKYARWAKEEAEVTQPGAASPERT